MSETGPNPGSDEAIAQGCICPVLDNGHGRRDDGRFVMVLGCPVHAPESVATRGRIEDAEAHPERRVPRPDRPATGS